MTYESPIDISKDTEIVVSLGQHLIFLLPDGSQITIMETAHARVLFRAPRSDLINGAGI